LNSPRIGHFAVNTEIYLCEQDAGINVPQQRYIDLFVMSKPICNSQLATMWKRVLHIWPSWILFPAMRVNRLVPGGAVHEVGNNAYGALDLLNLLDQFPHHLKFTAEEEAKGRAGLQAIGIPPDAFFVCLIVRDSAYLDSHQIGDWSCHNYRDCDIQNYVLAAEELANRGYFVIRMGVKVHQSMNTAHPKIIDYATNGMRSDFMDIYLGEKCKFCISTGTGWDAIPNIFRRPIVYVNLAPLGYMATFSTRFITIAKTHVLREQEKILTLREIFSHGVGFSQSTSDYDSKGVDLIENTPEEIRDVVIEMAERLSGTWQHKEDDEYLQRRFWEVFPTKATSVHDGRPLHGHIHARFGANFLRNNREWLQ